MQIYINYRIFVLNLQKTMDILSNDIIKGLCVGFLTSVPLGPLAILCIQRSLSKGRLSGFITGMGTACADTTFASLAILSLTLINSFLDSYQNWVISVGGIIVMFYGARLFLNNPIKKVRRKEESNKAQPSDFFSAFVMTITNPGALLLLLGIFAFVGIDIEPNRSGNIIAFTLMGVFMGASFWWFTLSSIISLLRHKFRLRQLIVINKVAGIIIMVFGLISFSEGVFQLIKPIISN